MAGKTAVLRTVTGEHARWWARMMDLGRRFAQSEALQRLVRAVGRTSPYTALALALPGGSLIALALWIFQDRASSTAPLRRALLIAAAGTALILPA